MHGTNKIKKLDRGDGSSIPVHQTWATIQGEGPFSGLPAVFIRISGCHLACTFCDTSWDDENDPLLPMDQVAAEMTSLWQRTVGPGVRPLFIFTGGEPTRVELGPLIKEIIRLEPRARCQIETAGSFWRDIMSHQSVSTVVSPKTSFVHPHVEQIACAYKYVIRSTDQFHPTLGIPMSSTQVEGGLLVGLATPAKHLAGGDIYLSPCDEQNDSLNAANMAACVDLAMRYGYRVQLQVHKYLGLE